MKTEEVVEKFNEIILGLEESEKYKFIGLRSGIKEMAILQYAASSPKTFFAQQEFINWNILLHDSHFQRLGERKTVNSTVNQKIDCYEFINEPLNLKTDIILKRAGGFDKSPSSTKSILEIFFLVKEKEMISDLKCTLSTIRLSH